ncbi:MAG: copper chaperone PCu(A)C [Roseinatronobacter sp.]
MFRLLKTAALAATLSVPVLAPAFAHEGVHVEDAYARASTAMSQTGAAFMRLENHSGAEIRLIEARSEIAARVELHTHLQDANGVMRMIEVKDGFPIPPHGQHMLMRGGDHVMFMGLRAPLVQGAEVPLTLVFDNGEVIDVMVPVDMERAPEAGAHGHSHGTAHKH